MTDKHNIVTISTGIYIDVANKRIKHFMFDDDPCLKIKTIYVL